MYFNPVKIINARNWLNACRKYQKKLGIFNPIVFTSIGNTNRLKLLEIFRHNKIFSNILPNPTLKTCQNAINFSKNKVFDGVIALGGGSVMDTAKAVMAANGTGEFNIEKLILKKGCFSHRIPSIFIPTTHGTGSEVTPWGTIWDIKKKRKISIYSPDLYPDIAILDGSLTLSLPIDISLITSLDALSHSFEAIWNKNANSTSTEFAINAIYTILKNIEQLKKNPQNLTVRKSLLTSSCKAGLAFSNTKTAAAHSISYPLTLYFGIPHGIASSIPLVPLIEINKPKIEKKLKLILDRLNLSKIKDLKRIIYAIPDRNLKFSLIEWGVKEEDIDWLVDQCFSKDRIINNITNLSKGDIYLILKQMLNYGPF